VWALAGTCTLPRHRSQIDLLNITRQYCSNSFRSRWLSKFWANGWLNFACARFHRSICRKKGAVSACRYPGRGADLSGSYFPGQKCCSEFSACSRHSGKQCPSCPRTIGYPLVFSSHDDQTSFSLGCREVSLKGRIQGRFLAVTSCISGATN